MRKRERERAVASKEGRRLFFTKRTRSFGDYNKRRRCHKLCKGTNWKGTSERRHLFAVTLQAGNRSSNVKYHSDLSSRQPNFRLPLESKSIYNWHHSTDFSQTRHSHFAIAAASSVAVTSHAPASFCRQPQPTFSRLGRMLPAQLVRPVLINKVGWSASSISSFSSSACVGLEEATVDVPACDFAWQYAKTRKWGINLKLN